MAITDTLIDTRPLRTSRAFRRLWIGSAASAFGGQITVVAVLYQVWQLTAESRCARTDPQLAKGRGSQRAGVDQGVGDGHVSSRLPVSGE